MNVPHSIQHAILTTLLDTPALQIYCSKALTSTTLPSIRASKKADLMNSFLPIRMTLPACIKQLDAKLLVTAAESFHRLPSTSSPSRTQLFHKLNNQLLTWYHHLDYRWQGKKVVDRGESVAFKAFLNITIHKTVTCISAGISIVQQLVIVIQILTFNASDNWLLYKNKNNRTASPGSQNGRRTFLPWCLQLTPSFVFTVSLIMTCWFDWKRRLPVEIIYIKRRRHKTALKLIDSPPCQRHCNHYYCYVLPVYHRLPLNRERPIPFSCKYLHLSHRPARIERRANRFKGYFEDNFWDLFPAGLWCY